MKLMKKMLTGAFAVTMVFGGSTSILNVDSIKAEAAVQTETNVLFNGIVITNVANIQNDTGSNAKCIGALAKNSIVEVLEIKDEWYQIKYKKGNGWVKSSNIENLTPFATTPVTEDIAKPILFEGKVVASYLNVREVDNPKGKRIGELPKNTIVEIIESKNGWYKIKYNNSYGWVFGLYVEIINMIVLPEKETVNQNTRLELPVKNTVNVEVDKMIHHKDPLFE